MGKLIPIIFILFFIVALPLAHSISGTITYANQPSSVAAGQQFSILSQVQLTSFNQNECSTNGCIIELDPWTFNGQPINNVNNFGIAQSIINLGTYSTSFCDSNPYYAGILTTLYTNIFYQTTFSPKAPLQAGAWTYKVNVYSQCGGNLLLSSSSIPIQVTAINTIPSTPDTIPSTPDTIVYCLSDDKKSCSSQLNNCNSGEIKYSDLSTCVSNKLIPPPVVNFKLSGLKKATYVDINYQTIGVTFLEAQTARKGNLYFITIENTGNTAGAKLELYYISKTNKLYDTLLKSTSSNIPLQSLLGQEGISLDKPNTCMNDIGVVLNIDPISQGQSKTFVVWVPLPKSGDKLGDDSNYNSEGKYLLIADILDKCDNAKIYNSIGGTLNFAPDKNIEVEAEKSASLTLEEYQQASSKAIAASACDFGSDCSARDKFIVKCVTTSDSTSKNKKAYEQKSSICSINKEDISIVGIIKIVGYALGGGYFCKSSIVPEGTCVATLIDGGNLPTGDISNIRQTTVTKDNIQKFTSVQLVKSSCNNNNMCEDNSICQSLDSLQEEGMITETRKQQDIQQINKYADTAAIAAGTTLAGIGGYSLGTAAITSEGAVIVGSVCSTLGVLTGGSGFPICLGVAAVGGAVGGFVLTKKVVNYFNDLSFKDTSKIGYCVPKTEDKLSFKGVTSDIGKSVNDFFGTKGKIKDFTIGVIVLGFLAYLLFFNKKS